jgi:hypothetical protein
MLSPSQATAFATTACLIGVAVWAWLSEFPVADPGRPSTKAEPLVLLEASVPAIGDFSEFQVNDENPFIPSNLRQIETTARQRPKATAGNRTPVVDIPSQVLPRLTASGSGAPAATGVIIAKGESLAMLTFPGNDHAEVMKIGESRHGWKVQAIEAGNRIMLTEEATGASLPLAVTIHDDGPELGFADPKAHTDQGRDKRPTGRDKKPDDKRPEDKKATEESRRVRGTGGDLPMDPPGKPERHLPPHPMPDGKPAHR